MLCGTEPFPQNVRAKKYKIHQHFIDKKNFHHMMTNLPEKVICGNCDNFNIKLSFKRSVRMTLKKCLDSQIKTMTEESGAK